MSYVAKIFIQYQWYHLVFEIYNNYNECNRLLMLQPDKFSCGLNFWVRYVSGNVYNTLSKLLHCNCQYHDHDYHNVATLAIKSQSSESLRTPLVSKLVVIAFIFSWRCR